MRKVMGVESAVFQRSSTICCRESEASFECAISLGTCEVTFPGYVCREPHLPSKKDWGLVGASSLPSRQSKLSEALLACTERGRATSSHHRIPKTEVGAPSLATLVSQALGEEINIGHLMLCVYIPYVQLDLLLICPNR